MTKQELRNIYKQKRLAISPIDKLKADDFLLIRFQQLFFDSIQVLLTYWPIEEMAEPNTMLFSGYLRHTIPGLQIAYPVTNFEANYIKAIAINEDTVYTTGLKNLTEPTDGILISPETIDLVFVPMIICNKEGYRVGYGKGFYDRFLAQCRPDIIKIGFSYFEPIEKIEDLHAFDVPLNYCITPENIYEF